MAKERTFDSGQPVTERRRHSRSYVAGVAVLSHEERAAGACLVRNLSEGGAMLLSCPPVAPGDDYQIALAAPGLMGEQLDVRVTRAGETAEGGCWAAVEFRRLSREARDRIRSLVTLEQRLDTAPLVLVIDESDERLMELSARLGHHSRRALLAKSFSMAVSCLNELEPHVGLIVLQRGLAGGESEVLTYLREHYPSVHLAIYDATPSEDALRRLLDRTEAEAYDHLPWTCE